MDLVPYSDRESPDKIWFLRRDRGDSAIGEFIANLDTRTLAATTTLFDRTELAGPPHNVEKFRHLKADVYEFKIHQAVAVRYLAFAASIGWVIAVAQRKGKTGELQRSIIKTQSLHDEYEELGHE